MMTEKSPVVEQAVEMLLQQAHNRARRYMDELVTMTSAPDILALRVFPNAKEVTESMAGLHAVRKHLGVGLFADRGIHMVAVGDGCTPRTAALFAFLTRWTCWSVDPRLRLKDRYARVDRLHLHADRVETFTLPPCARAVIVAVHSHASLGAAVRACVGAERLDVVAIPCCVPQDLLRPPDVEYEDHGISSPERTVRIWREATK